MLADKNLVGALCANFAAAAEPEASYSLLNGFYDIHRIKIQPAVTESVPRSTYSLCAALHESRCLV